MSDSLWPHGLQHTRLPCPSLSPRVYSTSCPLSQWYYLTISCSAVCLQSFSASRSFPISYLFTPAGLSIGVPTSASVPPMNIEVWFPLGLTLIFLLSRELSGVFSSTTIQKHQFFGTQPSLWSGSYIHTWLLENHSFDYMDFVGKVMSLLFNTES